MNQEPQSPLWPESEIKTIGKRDLAGTFGERLKRERELRSITLDEMANSTKIGTRMLHALEDEEFEKLPGGIFNKGFVRAYAKFLGLDEEQAVADYLAAEAEKERKRRAPSTSQENAKENQPQLFAIQGGARPDNIYNIRASVEIVENPPDPAGGFLKAAVILVFALGIGGFAWKYYSSHSSSSASAAPRQVQQPPVVTSAPVITTPAQPVQVQDAGANTTPASKKPDTPPSSGSVKTAETVPVEPRDSASISTAPPANSPGGFTLDLRAEENSWAQITADGKTLWSGVVSKDATKSFHAAQQMVIKLGNAPAVQLAYNGKPLPRFSQDSKTRTLTFTPEGLAPR